MGVLLLALLAAEPVVVVRAAFAKPSGAGHWPDVPVLAPLFCTAADGGFTTEGCLERRSAVTKVKFLDGRRASTVGLEALAEHSIQCSDEGPGPGLCDPRPLWRTDPEKSVAVPGLGQLAVAPAHAVTVLPLKAGAKKVALPPELVGAPLRPPRTKDPTPRAAPTTADAWSVEGLELLVTTDAIADRRTGQTAWRWTTARGIWPLNVLGAFRLAGVDAVILVTRSQHAPGWHVALVSVGEEVELLSAWGAPDF